MHYQVCLIAEQTITKQKVDNLNEITVKQIEFLDLEILIENGN